MNIDMAMISKCSVAAVIVTYNRKNLLEKCVFCLLNQTHPPDEIFIIDNASTDGTKDLITLGFPNITYIQLVENIGGSGGFNKGIKLAYEKGYEWIWVMDDDVIPEKNLLEKLLGYSFLLKDCNIVGLVPRRVEKNGETISHEGIINNNPNIPNIFEYPDLLLHEYIKINKFTFEGPLFSREGIRKIGFPDTKYFLFYDDVDFGFRLSQIGNVYYIRDAVMTKMLSFNYEFSNSNQWRWYYRWRNHIFFVRKNLTQNTLMKLWNWLKSDEDIIAVREGYRTGDLNSLKYTIILLKAIMDNFGKMGKTYSPQDIVVRDFQGLIWISDWIKKLGR